MGFLKKKNILIIIIAAILLIGGGVTAVMLVTSSIGASAVETALKLAEKYLLEQNYEQAIIEYSKVLEIEPMNVDAIIGLAEAYIGLGDTEKALEILRDGYEKTGDERIGELLQKYDVDIRSDENKPKTSDADQTNETVQSEESYDDGLLDLTWTDVNDSVIDLNFGHKIMYDDGLYGFIDKNGNMISDERYKSIDHFIGTENENYALAITEDDFIVCIDKYYNQTLDLSAIEYLYIFNADDPLIMGCSQGEYDNGENNAYIVVYKPDGTLLFSWTEGMAIDGSNQLEYLDDPLIPDSIKTYSCSDEYHQNLWVDEVSSTFTAYATSYVNDELYVGFHLDVNFEYDHAIEEAAWAAEKEQRRQEALANGDGRYVWAYAHNTHGHSNYAAATYKISYTNGKVFLEFAEEGSMNPPSVLLKEPDYQIIQDNIPLGGVNFYKLIKDDSVKQMAIRYEDYYNYDDVTYDVFDYVGGIINSEYMWAVKYKESEPDTPLYAIFKTCWNDIVTESPQFGDGSHGTPDGVWSYGYEVIDNSEFEQVTDFYDYISWSLLDDYGYIMVRKDDKWGFVSIETGEKLIMADDASDFQNGYAIISNNGIGHVVDSDFNVISEDFPCDSCHTIGDNQFCVFVNDDSKILTLSIYE